MQIVYEGHTPLVSVPDFRPEGVTNVARDVPIDVPRYVAEDLTQGGTSATWRYVAAPVDEPVDEHVDGWEG